MISTEIQLDTKLLKSKALQLILRNTLAGELVSFEYDEITGLAIVRTRGFPAFNELEFGESDLSIEVTRLAEDYKIANTKLNDRKRLQDQRESDLNNKENELTDRERLIVKGENQLTKQRQRFEKDLQDAGRKGFGAAIKSFFHTIR